MAAASAVLVQSFTPIVGGETIIRTRGLFSVASDQVASAESYMGAYGLAVVTAQALSVGITAIPHPVTDAPWGGWFFHQYFCADYHVVASTGIAAPWFSNYVIDSKAMRKLDEDERLVAVVENSSGEGMKLWDSIRILTKVH